MVERIIPIKVGACINCGVSVQIKTNPKVLCAVCKVSRKREQSVIGAATQRRKKGILQVKDVPIACSDCGVQFMRASFRAVRCIPCQSSKLKYSTRQGKDAANEYYSMLRKTNHRWAIRARMRTLMHRALGDS